MIHSWYNLGALHSHHCKDQADFMSQLRSLSNDCAFTNADEVVKFLFLIHNSHKRVQDQFLKDVTKNSSPDRLSTKCETNRGSYPDREPSP